MKNAAKRVMALPLLLKPLKRFALRNSDICIVLSFHRILPKGHPDYRYTEPELVVDAQQFAAFVETLADATEVLDAESFIQWLCGNYTPERTSSLITFDDGWKDVAAFAAEHLKRLKLPAVVFVCPEAIEKAKRTLWFEEAYRLTLKAMESGAPLPFADARTDAKATAKRTVEALKRKPEAERDEALAKIRALCDDDDSERLLSWDEIKELASFGIEPQCHTLSHEILTALTDSEIRNNLTESARMIEEKCGSRPRLIAYPNGEADARVAKIAAECGFIAGFTTDEGRANRLKDHSMLLPRRVISDSSTPSKAVFVWKLAGLP